MYKSLRISKYHYLCFYYRKDRQPAQIKHGPVCFHKFSNSHNYLLYLWRVTISIEELMDNHFRPVRLTGVEK